MWLTLFLWAVSFVLADYFRAKLPAVEPSGEGDFQSPTATEGRKVPQVVGGTIKVKGPNTLYTGDWEAEAVTVETGIIFKKDETVGYLYRVALALGQFQGEAAGMTAIYIGDDKVWDYVADNGSVPGDVADISLPDLFGGETKGGGFVGRVRAFNGAPGQVVSQYLLSKNPLQSAWPSFCYVVVTDPTETIGAEIGEANQLREIRVEWQMWDTVANGGLGDGLSLGNNHHFIGRDANPISAAFNVINNPNFGLSIGEIDYVNWKAAAEVCYTEGIGYSQLVDNEQEAGAILAEIEKHVDGYFGANPTTGLMEITLARAGYTPANEFQATESNVLKIIDYAKPEWPQTKNEVKIRFVNRDKNYTDDHAVAQDMAGRLITGRPQSVTIRFPGLREANAANAIVARTSRAYFWPLSKFGMEMDRTAYALRPGDVVIVTHPDIAAVNLPTRVSHIATGDPIKQTIRVDVVEDVFQAELGLQSAPQASGHVPPSSAPVTISVHQNTMAPRWLMEINEQTLEPRLLFLVARDAPNTAYNLSYRTRENPFSGNFSAVLTDGSPSFTRYGTLRANLGHLVSTFNDGTVSVANGGGFQVDGPYLSSLAGTYNPRFFFDGLIVINPGQPNEEFCAMGACAINGAGVECSLVIRGVGDSAVNAHLAGEPVFFIDKGAYMQINSRPISPDGSWGYQYTIQPVAQGVAGTATAFQGEQLVSSTFWKPYPPTAVFFNRLSTTIWFGNGDLDLSAPNSIGAPSFNGFDINVWNRRFDQLNPMYGANTMDDIGNQLPPNSFVDVGPVLNWFMYDLDDFPSPVRGDEYMSGTTAILDDATNNLLLPQSLWWATDKDYPINTRIELTWENTASPDVGGVVAGLESNSLFMDKIITGTPDPEGVFAVDETRLLLHMEGFDRTTQFIDYSSYAHTVTPFGDAQVDGLTPEDTGMGLGSLRLIVPNSPGSYLEVTEQSPSAFFLDLDPGFVIQFRIRFTETPSGTIPIVTKWRTSDNQRQFWVGLINTTIQIKYSVDGTAELTETTGVRTWTLNQWYEVVVCVWGVNTYFFVDGVFDERQPNLWGPMFNGAAPVRIGADGDGNLIPQSVNIDEVRIINSPVYKVPYTKNVIPLPGRERGPVVLYADWNKAADNDVAYNTDDLNRYTLRFPLNEVTSIDAAEACFVTSPAGKALFCGGVNGSGFDNSDGVLLENTGPGLLYADRWDFGLGDFTMECFVKLNATPAAHTGDSAALIKKRFRGVGPFLDWQFHISKTSLLEFTHQGNEGILNTLSSAAQTWTVGVWYHVAVCRENGVLALFKDGDRIAQSLTIHATRDYGNFRAGVCLGRQEQNSTADHSVLNGWLDNVRVLKGVAAYPCTTSPATGAYTVPTAYFATDPVPQAELPILSFQSDWTPLNL